jgi:membrane fusion protein (multidrug efflux system)
MAKRMLLMLLIVGALIVALGLVKFRQIQAASSGSAFQPPPEAVTTIVARQEPWEQTLGAIGTVTAVNGVTVSADLPGIVQEFTFDSGRTVQAGEVLVRLDTRQERAQLSAAEARRDLANLELERTRGLLEQGITSQSDYDRATAEAKQSEALVGEIRATIDRKVIRAPFSGVLGIRQVNLGQYLKGGDPVVSLQSLHPIYVNFSVPQQVSGDLHAGAEVEVTMEGSDRVEKGRISAVNSIIDEATRNLEIQATFDNPDEMLRPGMFVEAQVVMGAGSNVIALPGSSVSYAPYGDSVFIVEDVKGPNGQTYRGVRQQFVTLGPSRGDQVAVLAGVKAGEEIVTSGVFKLRAGAAVTVNNEIQPSNNPAPKPEDS